MPTYTRKDLATLWQHLAKGETAPVYLLFGDRYLCRKTADELINHLLPDSDATINLKKIDGDQENPIKTLNQLRTFGLFAGRQVIRVTDTRLFLSKKVGKNVWNRAKEAYDSKDGRQAGRNLLRLLALAGLTPDDWLDEDIAGLSANKWKSLFGFTKPPASELKWVAETLASLEEPADDAPVAPPTTEAAELYADALEQGLPKNNTLVLLSEAVDKRKRLYKTLADKGVVVDLSVDSGYSRAATEQREVVLKELIETTLAEFGKKIEPQGLALLLDRVGFHPVAVTMETEKLALATDDEPLITRQDVDTLVGRTREEALFELTEAFADRNLGRTLYLVHRLHENSIHPLAILAGLRNHLRKLMLLRSFQELPGYRPGMSFAVFQKQFLPGLKQDKAGWLAQLPGHPYALFMMFGKAEKLDLADLQAALAGLLNAEHRLKSTPLPPTAVLEDFLYNHLLAAGASQQTPGAGKRFFQPARA